MIKVRGSGLQLRITALAAGSVIVLAVGACSTQNSVGQGDGGAVQAGTGITISTVAGAGISDVNGSPIYFGDGAPATKAGLVQPVGVAFDSRGNMFISDGNSRIRRVAAVNGKITADSVITTVAGNGTAGFSGDGSAASKAMLNWPHAIATDKADNLYVADTSNHRVRKLATVNGEVTGQSTISTVAGDGAAGFSGDGGPATKASLNMPVGVSVAPDNSLYVADPLDNRIRLVGPNGIISTVAGNGTAGFSGDGGPATSAELSSPEGVTISSDHRLFIADMVNQRIRRVDPDGTISTIAGTGEFGFSGDGGPATAAALAFPIGLSFDRQGNLAFAEGGFGGLGSTGPDLRVRQIDTSGTISTISGTGVGGFCGDGGPAASAQLGNPTSVAFDAAGDLYVADTGVARIRKIALASAVAGSSGGAAASGTAAPTAGMITTFTGFGYLGSCGLGGPATAAAASSVYGLAADSGGSVFLADRANAQVRKVGPDGIITAFAGNGQSGFSGDGGPAVDAQFVDVRGLALDSAGNLYLADTAGSRVRKVDANGIITTLAGTGVSGFSGDGGPATQAQIEMPWGIAVDASGNVFVASLGSSSDLPFPRDGNNARIRKIATDGTITTIAGTGVPGFSGDGGPATKAQFARPTGLAIDRTGNLLVVDSGNHRIRQIDRSGKISTIAGTDVMGFSGDGGPAAKASFSIPWAISTDQMGNVFISDITNNDVRMINTKGIITTVAGTAPGGYNGDNISATAAWLARPYAVAAGPNGRIYSADTTTFRVRTFQLP